MTPTVDEQVSFAVLLRRFRLAAGFTQEDLAERAGLSWRGISDLERGERRSPQRETVRLLVQALGLSPTERTELETAARKARPRSVAPHRTETISPMFKVPVPPTPLVGREQELADIQDQFDPGGARLVTLCGTGGVGKTRLAIEFAHVQRMRFAGGVCFVMLESVHEPALVLPTIARALGLSEARDLTTFDQLVVQLSQSEFLLVLDNFEQVPEAAVEVASLLAACARLKVVVTSRTPLEIRAEHVIDVAPLPLPAIEDREPDNDNRYRTVTRSELESLGAVPAISLFTQRATAISSRFQLAEDNALTIARICSRLDGLPLAIELAAARVREMSPDTILNQLERRLQLLTTGARDLPKRHQSLRAAFEWSKDLLSRDEQIVFRRLSVFAGGWSADAAIAVCSDPISPDDIFDPELEALSDNPTGRTQPRVGGDQVPSLLDGLVRQSLVVAGDDGEHRYRMLMTIREFANELLEIAENVDAVRDRHLTWILRLCEQPVPDWNGPKERRWLERVEPNRANLRAALAWCSADPTRATQGLRLAAASRPLWSAYGPALEGLSWLDKFLAGADDVGSELGGRSLRQAGALAITTGDYPRAITLLEEALQWARDATHIEEIAHTLKYLARASVQPGDAQSAIKLYREALALFRQLGDNYAAAEILSGLASKAVAARDYPRVKALCQESIRLCSVAVEGYIASDPLNVLGRALAHEGDNEGAYALLSRALDTARRSETPRNHGDLLRDLGVASLRLRKLDLAEQHLREGLAAMWKRNAMVGVASCLYVLADVYVERGQDLDAVRLYAIADDLWRSVGMTTHFWADPGHYPRQYEGIRRRIGDDEFKREWDSGLLVSLSSTIAELSDEDSFV